MNKHLRLSIALALALGGSHAHALGLGQIEVKSALNQPLLAEIPVLTSSAGEADGLAVRLASADAFSRAGLDGLALQKTDLNLEVGNDAHGRTVIRVTTSDRVSDPFLSFLLEVDWGKGKMLREYTVLLDPPSMVPIAASAATVTPVVEPAPAFAEPLQEAETPAAAFTPPPEQPMAPPVASSTPTAPVEAAPAPQYAAPAPQYSADSYGPVNAGDTLWSIAQQSRPDDSVTINQMMMALLQANPDAFIDNNINRLKKGAVLRIPGRDEASVVAAAEAAAQVREQMQRWSGATATVSQPADASSSMTASSTRPAGSTADSRLELTPPRGGADADASQSGATADGMGQELRAELARTREEASALAHENVELKSRVTELEQLQNESRRLLELKDSELATIQSRLADADAAASQPDAMEELGELATEADASFAESDGAGIADADGFSEDADLAMAPDDTDVMFSDDAEADLDGDMTTDAEYDPVGLDESATPVEPAEELPVAGAPPAQPEQSSGGFMGLNSWVLGGMAALLAGLAGALMLRRRKKKTVSPVVASAGEVTPAAVAYEPDQDEDELIEALSEYPDDLQLHLDLMHHYFARNDIDAFEMAAEAMYAQVEDVQDPAWQEALSLGQQISPEHPLFAVTAADLTEYPLDETLADDDVTGRFDDDGAPVEVDDAAVDRDIDWLPGAAAAQDAPQMSEPSQDDAVTFEAPTLDELLDEKPSGDVASDDFRFEEDDEEDESDGLSLDERMDESFDAVDADAATTKLELARAYLDMGDAEGARGMLEEVLTEGTQAQRDEAQGLIDGIS